jgi:glucokinase
LAAPARRSVLIRSGGWPDFSEMSRSCSSMIARAYEKDDELVRKVVDRSAELLGGAIANLVTVLSIDCVVLGGGVTEALGEPYVARVRKGFDRVVFPSSLRRIDFLASTLNDDAGMLGAAMLV